MKLTSFMALRPLCLFTILALAVLALPSLVLPFWYNMIKHVEHELASGSQTSRSEIRSEIENRAKLLLPLNSSAATLAGSLNRSLDRFHNPSLSAIHDTIAPKLFQSLFLIPHLSQVSYIAPSGFFFSFHVAADRVLAAYSNGSLASDASNESVASDASNKNNIHNNNTWYVQGVDRSGRLYGDAMSMNGTWIGGNGFEFGSIGFSWSGDNEFLFFNTVETVRGRVSLGFSAEGLVGVFSSVGLGGGRLYLSTLGGVVLLEGVPGTRMVVGNGSVSIESVDRNGGFVGIVSCDRAGGSSVLRIQGDEYLLVCSPIQIMGVQSVYALAFPNNGLESGVRSKSRVVLILFIVMLITILITISSFVLLMVRAARREMTLCSSLIKQMEATQQAERKSMNKSVAFAKASHDVRASLAGITGLIDLSYQEVARGSELESNLRQMDACSNDLLGLLNSILDTTKIEAGKMELNEEEFDLAQLLEDVVDLFHPLAMKKNVDVILDPHDGSVLKHPHVKGDRAKLKQILSNLVSNAVKFTSKGHVSVRAWIETQPSLETSMKQSGFVRRMWCWFSEEESVERESVDATSFVVEVEDTGKGIPKEAREGVFENYVQVKDSALAQGGTGLGLGIVQSLVRLMGGDIQIIDKDSDKNGTCFRFNVLLTARDPFNTHSVSGTDSVSVHRQNSSLRILTNHSPRLGLLSRSPRSEGSHVVILIQNEERRRVSQKFIESLGIKVTLVEKWESLGPKLKRIKHKLSLSSSKSDMSPRSFNRSRNSSRDMPLSSMDGNDQNVLPIFNKISSGSRSGLVLILLDANAGPVSELSKAVAEFRRGSQKGLCRVVWLEKPGAGRVRVEDGFVDPNDVVVTKPFHGSRLGQVVRLLPEFGGGLGLERSWRGSSSSENYGHVRMRSGDSSSCNMCPTPATTPATTPTLGRFRSESRGSLPQETSPTPTRSEIHEVGSSSSNKPLSGKRILIAEDNAVLLKIAMMSVKQLGATVESCENGKEAVELVCNGLENQLRYDYILMDCQMPEMDGYEATRRIREAEEHYGVHIPIIAVTAHTAESEETKEAIEAGMDIYLCKPLKPHHLLEAIRYVHTKSS